MELEVMIKEKKNSKDNTKNADLNPKTSSHPKPSTLCERETSTTYKITALADLHGHFPENLPGGDILIIAGDISSGKFVYLELDKLKKWMDKQNYKHKIFISGNHDECIKGKLKTLNYDTFVNKHYLEDGAYIFDDMIIWGTPWSVIFPEVNPYCKEFMECETELKYIYKLIPKDIDILISHSPPKYILDRSFNKINCGSQALMDRIEEVRPKLVIFGHIHEHGGKMIEQDGITYFNASIRDECYRLSRPLDSHTFEFTFSSKNKKCDGD